TDRALAIGRKIDVLRDHRQRLSRLRAGLLLPHGDLHRRSHIRWKIGGGTDDEGKDAIEERCRHPISIICEWAASSMIPSASTPFPPTRTTASRRPARSKTSPSA